MKTVHLEAPVLGAADAKPQKPLVQQLKAATLAALLGSVIFCVSPPTATYAAEGASSHYLPGAVGDIFLAVPPEPGFTAANMFWYQTGSTDAALLEGQLSLGLDLDLFLNIASLSYTFEKVLLGGRYTIGTAIPFGYAGIDGTLIGPRGGSIDFSDDSFDLSDIAIIPFQMNWNTGPWSFSIWESIVAPTGGYEASGSTFANLGRNYWSFDTVGAVTWFKSESGTEVSVAPGVMFNTENPDTEYQTGTEFHVDFVANQFISETFALGLRGYYYKQLTGDSGAGATLGDFKSESFALGPGLVWTVGRFTVLGKWLHDFSAENRFESDYVTLTVAWTF